MQENPCSKMGDSIEGAAICIRKQEQNVGNTDSQSILISIINRKQYI